MLLTTAIASLCLLPQQQTSRVQDEVIAVVGEEQITESHLRIVSLLAGYKELPPRLREPFINRLVENRLLSRFLTRAGYKVRRSELVQAYKDRRLQLKGTEIDLKKELRTARLSETAARNELAAGLLWNKYKLKSIADTAIAQRFTERKIRYDGTMVRASQIFLKLKSDKDWPTAEAKLTKIRDSIVAKETTFADAAKKYSESPSAKRGGDVGFFPWSGVMSRDFSQHSFALKKGEVGLPFRSRYGAHLVLVTEIKPGKLNREDARIKIYRELEDELKDRIVADEKKTTKVEIKNR